MTTITAALRDAAASLSHMAEKKYNISYTVHDYADQAEIADIAVDAAQEARAVVADLMIKLSDIVSEWSEAPKLDDTDRDMIRNLSDEFSDLLSIARDRAEDMREWSTEAAE